MYMSLSYGYCLVSNYKNYGQKFGYSDNYLILIVGNITSFSNGGFRFIFGILCDKIGFKNSYNIIIILNIISSLTLPYIVKDDILYPLWMLIIALSEGSHFSIFPVKIA